MKSWYDHEVGGNFKSLEVGYIHAWLDDNARQVADWFEFEIKFRFDKARENTDWLKCKIMQWLDLKKAWGFEKTRENKDLFEKAREKEVWLKFKIIKLRFKKKDWFKFIIIN